MMIKALLVAGAAVASAQCYLQSATNCTAAQGSGNANCTVFPGYCTRLGTVSMGAQGNTSACNASAATAACTNECGGTAITDAKVCTKCADLCVGKTSDACAAASGQCWWNNASCTEPTPTPAMACYGNTAQGTCVAETGCFWLAATQSICGASTVGAGQCAPCSYTTVQRLAYALANGKTCTWTAAGAYTQPFSVSVTAFAQNKDCSANAASTNAAADALVVKTAYGNVYADATSVVTCVQASGAMAVLPSLAILGLVLAVIA